MKLTGADIICECLLEQGVDTVFGYPGGAALNTYDALYKYSDKIKHILTAHEQGASHAADGYARSTGKTGVVLTTSGPGATNIVRRPFARRSSLPAAAERVLFWWMFPRTSPRWSPSLSRSVPKRPSRTPSPIPIPSRVCRRLSAKHSQRGRLRGVQAVCGAD